MYEMYSWNTTDDHRDEAADAVQAALDLRDNGGVPSR
ncbi:hypothetical protein SAMN05421505_11318 [Sinosporangium album]|uniref:Uncharacterized protein n=1 Tax=Sinosporangium album TaxID=504805 RepID=A0A1G8AVS7_9ACTN|nr:hypothetical protein SAMN05421505_11318 [Sinosporangium album]